MWKMAMSSISSLVSLRVSCTVTNEFIDLMKDLNFCKLNNLSN